MKRTLTSLPLCCLLLALLASCGSADTSFTESSIRLAEALWLEEAENHPTSDQAELVQATFIEALDFTLASDKFRNNGVLMLKADSLLTQLQLQKMDLPNEPPAILSHFVQSSQCQLAKLLMVPPASRQMGWIMSRRSIEQMHGTKGIQLDKLLLGGYIFDWVLFGMADNPEGQGVLADKYRNLTMGAAGVTDANAWSRFKAWVAEIP